LDARALLNNLESYLRGNRNAMSIEAVPRPEQEQQRDNRTEWNIRSVAVAVMVRI